MNVETTVYMRGGNNRPVGVLVFQNTTQFIDGLPVVALGWSKAHRDDTFTKKVGRTIAMKRSIKAMTWFLKRTEKMVISPIPVNSVAFAENTSSLPFAVKENIEQYCTQAKYNLGLDGQCVFIIPVIELMANLVDVLRSEDDPSMTVQKRRVTRYLKVIY